MTPGDFLEVHLHRSAVGDRYSEPDQETGDRVEITERNESAYHVFLIRKKPMVRWKTPKAETGLKLRPSARRLANAGPHNHRCERWTSAAPA